MSEFTGPVCMSESQAVVQQLRDLAERAQQNNQRLFYFVLGTTAESLDDNLQMALDMGLDMGVQTDE